MTHFKRSISKNISDRNVEENRGWVINEMNKIESKIDKVITQYFKPDDPLKFQKIMLNSSIIPIGAKIKILGNIEKFDKIILNKIRDISSIRNAFAHIPILIHFKFEENTNSIGDFKAISITDKIEVMNSAGILKLKSVKEELERFSNLNEEIVDYFNSYI
ncbi:hypothetical protein [uncultured Flavobacterium sp.]|uniref:hypothetical protein n=1 Tax=uncultured Flavobacterium sp. TaxID=165435 RepID=UPI00292F3BB4|nr:hypothetical protein [uncultured Flavobacterium sp.]